jgi:hypothetical protein
MSGGLSRTKGKLGELEVAALVRDAIGWDVRRRVRQHDGDSDLEGVPGWSIEVKRHRTATRGNLMRWWMQACAQASDENLPVLLYRPDRGEWRAVWPLAALTTERRDVWRGYAWTCDTSIEAWAAVARELAASIAIGMIDKSRDAPRAGGKLSHNTRDAAPATAHHEIQETTP